MTLLLVNYPDKFGYYQVGDFKTYSKMEAFEVSNRTGKVSNWKFNDEVYSSIDWRKEPQQNLWEMYKARAKQIRNEYDYVVLFYSGGSDSHNILNAWIEADCKIDEIASVCNYDASGNPQDFMNAEVTNVVLPDIEFLQNKGLEFKFRLIDISQYSLDIFKYFNLDYEYYANGYVSVNNTVRSLFREKIQDYIDIIDSGKKLCFVWGIEKPIVQFDGRHYFRFIDNIDSCVSPYVQKNYARGWYDELFYWSCDAPLIPIKQAHIIKNFIEICNDPIYYQFEKTIYGYNKNINQFLKIETVKTLIYPKWSNDIFCNGKTASFIFSDRDKWLYSSNLELKERYHQIVKHLVQTGHIKNKNITPQYSMHYYLE